MKSTYNQILFLKKLKKKPLASIYVRITVNGHRTEFSTQQQCDPEKWDVSSRRLRGRSPEVREMNTYLDGVESRIFQIYNQLLNSGNEINGEAIKNRFLGIHERPRLLIEIFQQHNDQFLTLVDQEFSHGTWKKYNTCLNSVKKFLLWKLQISDIDIKTINFEFINDYEYYLKAIQKIQHNTAMGHIKKLKKIIGQCVAKDWISKNPFLGYKMKLKETHRTYLLKDELERLIEKEIPIDRLDIVRDIFVFSCFSGLSYSDVEKLTPSDIARGIDGEKWIFTTRTKTGTPSRVPLLPAALRIIEKYETHIKVLHSGKLLPILSNQKMNSYLKELATTCHIQKELTFHCARHTFATTVTLTNGVPIESVSKMLGHKKIQTTQQYAKILDQKVSEDMGLLRRKFTKIPSTGINQVKEIGTN